MPNKLFISFRTIDKDLIRPLYSRIKEECWDRFESDIRWMMEDLDALVEKTFKDKYPLYYDLLIYKIDGKSNLEIQ